MPDSPQPAAPTPPPRQRRRFQPPGPWWAWLIIGAPALWLVAWGAAILLQQRLIYPGQWTRGTALANIEPPPGARLVKSKTNGQPFVALYGGALTAQGRPMPAGTRPALLFFYGNGDCLAFERDHFEALRRMGVHVLIPEYPGYGLNEGSPSEAGLYATADAALEYLLSRPEVDTRRIVVVGWSLGGAVAIDLAARKRVAGLAAFSTFTSMEEMAQRMFPLLPASWFLRNHFSSEAKMPAVRCPILLGHGDEDRRVPYAMMERLAAAAEAPVTRFTAHGAGHNDFFAGEDGKAMRELAAFIRRLPPMKEIGEEP